MGVPAPGDPRMDGQSTFCDDLLRIELRSPKKSHLSVIDVPGIFRTPEEGKTTAEDRSLVNEMVRRYIENPRTVILAVLPANVDFATTEILEMAAEVDPTGQRTLGILTKPDLVDEGAEQDIVDLVMGRRKKLSLGYCVVRNRGQRDRMASSAERNQMELDFFKSKPWSSLDKNRVGISALSARLRDLLTAITRREFATVVREIGGRLAACEEDLRSFGPSRETPEQQRRYILDIATMFQEITKRSLEAQYGSHQCLKDDKTLRLATLIVDFNSEFSEDVERRGHTLNFSKTKSTAGKTPRKVKLRVRSRKLSSEASPVATFDFKMAKGHEEAATAVDPAEYPELSDVLPSLSTRPLPKSDDMLAWIEREYKSSRGFELGTFNPSLLPTLFQEQSKNWEELVGIYVTNVIGSVHRFFYRLLKHLCTEERVMTTLWSFMMDSLLQRYRRAVEQVRFILRTERRGTLWTTNHEFSKQLEKLRVERTSTAEESKEFFFAENRPQPSVTDNLKDTVRVIHDVLRSYYGVAQKRFVDTVWIQVTDYHLITGPDTPLGFFSPGFVVDLPAEQLETIAGEDAVSIQRRRDVEKEIESLREGRRILKS